MDVADKLFLEKLKSAGYSNTRARRAVFEALKSDTHHPLSMNELVLKTVRQADRSSIYRSVDLLEQIGIIKKLYQGWKYKLELSDDFHGHHHHLTCIQCGNIHSTHDDEEFESLIDGMAQKHGYTVTDHQIEIRGLCKKCQSNTLKN